MYRSALTSTPVATPSRQLFNEKKTCVFFLRDDADESGGQRWQAAQIRRRGPSVLERLRADEEAAVQAVTAASERWAKWRKTAAGELSLGCTGDVAMKSGMVPAREIQPFNHCRGPKVLADAGSRQRIQVRRGTRWRVARRPRSARRRGERGGQASEEARRASEEARRGE